MMLGNEGFSDTNFLDQSILECLKLYSEEVDGVNDDIILASHTNNDSIASGNDIQHNDSIDSYMSNDGNSSKINITDESSNDINSICNIFDENFYLQNFGFLDSSNNSNKSKPNDNDNCNGDTNNKKNNNKINDNNNI